MIYDLHKDPPNFKDFLVKAFETLHPTKQLIDNWHLDLITQYLDSILDGSIKRMIFNLPPRALKSITINVAWTAWLLGVAPDQKIINISYNQELSHKHAKDCRLIMESSWYKEMFPNTRLAKGFNKVNKFCTTQGGFRLSTSPNGTLTGEGADLIIIDDPISAVDINSYKKREKIKIWFDNVLLSRLNNATTGSIVLVMQRLHPEDLTGYLASKSCWTKLVIPAIADKEESIVFRKFCYIREKNESLYDDNIMIDGFKAKNWRKTLLHRMAFMLLKVVYRPIIYSKIIYDARWINTIPSSYIPTNFYDYRPFVYNAATIFGKSQVTWMPHVNNNYNLRENYLPEIAPNLVPHSFIQLKREIGVKIFDTQYQQKVETSSCNLIKKGWLHYYHDFKAPLLQELQDVFSSHKPDLSTFELIYQSWDCAIKAGDRNDYTVCSSWGVKNGQLYLLNILKLKIEYPSLREVVLTMGNLFQVDTILIEDSAAGAQLIQEINGLDKSLKVLGIKPKLDKITRLTLVSHLFEQGVVLLPISAIWLKDFLNEILNFPDTVHDDQVDSITQFLLWYQTRAKTYNYKFNFL